jgi:DNA-binding LacI/PurR family transcriptional regulator
MENSKPGQVRTIADIARLAGVSPGTVSRALSGSTLVRPRTRDHIKELAREYGFTPNVTARNLRTQRTGAIGVIVPLGHDVGQHISDPFFMTMIGHLADLLTERGQDLFLSRIIPSNDDWLSRIVDSGRVDGVIVIGQSDQFEALDRVAERYRPMVVWGANNIGRAHCTVGTDNFLGGELATRHLIKQGARRIAFFGNPVGPEIAQRLEGCCAALQAAGIPAPIDILPSYMTPESAHPAILQWLKEQDSPPDGIVCASDVIAMCALRALSEAGLSVPGDVRVMGYDDLAIAGQTTPPLSTIRQDLIAGAAHLVDLLFRRIGGETPGSVVIPPSLVVRASA